MTTREELPFLLLAAATAAVDTIQDGTVRRGFDDLRPVHGFVFLRVSGGGCTVAQLAEHLGVSKQAASVTVEELTTKGYLAKTTHPSDRRAILVVLTDLGVAATRAATAAAADALEAWSEQLGAGRLDELAEDLSVIAAEGHIRPPW